jgi:Rrf2 family protein
MSLYGASIEYGVHCMLHLVNVPDDVWLSAKDVAEFQGVSAPYVAKLFTQLKDAGLLVSTEGKQGGFRLARPPAEISVLDVIDALETDKKLFDCKEVRALCVLHNGRPPSWATAGLCELHAAMRAAEQRMRTELAHVTLGSLVASVAHKIPHEFGLRTQEWFAERQHHRRTRATRAAL